MVFLHLWEKYLKKTCLVTVSFFWKYLRQIIYLKILFFSLNSRILNFQRRETSFKNLTNITRTCVLDSYTEHSIHFDMFLSMQNWKMGNRCCFWALLKIFCYYLCYIFFCPLLHKKYGEIFFIKFLEEISFIYYMLEINQFFN